MKILPFRNRPTAELRPDASHAEKGPRAVLLAEKSSQTIEKSRFGRENPSKSKGIQEPKFGVLAAKPCCAKKTQIGQLASGRRRGAPLAIRRPTQREPAERVRDQDRLLIGTPYRARIASRSRATMLVILIAGLTAGPAVSL